MLRAIRLDGMQLTLATDHAGIMAMYRAACTKLLAARNATFPIAKQITKDFSQMGFEEVLAEYGELLKFWCDELRYQTYERVDAIWALNGSKVDGNGNKADRPQPRVNAKSKIDQVLPEFERINPIYESTLARRLEECSALAKEVKLPGNASYVLRVNRDSLPTEIMQELGMLQLLSGRQQPVASAPAAVAPTQPVKAATSTHKGGDRKPEPVKKGRQPEEAANEAAKEAILVRIEALAERASHLTGDDLEAAKDKARGEKDAFEKIGRVTSGAKAEALKGRLKKAFLTITRMGQASAEPTPVDGNDGRSKLGDLPTMQALVDKGGGEEKNGNVVH